MFQAGGIEVNVADQLQKVSIPVTKNCFVPALKKMADPPVTAVIVLRVCELNALEDFRERRLSGFEQKMNVVGHQNVGVNYKLIALPVVFDSLEVIQPITIVVKDLLPLIATDDDVIECPFEFHPRFPRHAGDEIRKVSR
jgi:hypothetical protein